MTKSIQEQKLVQRPRIYHDRSDKIVEAFPEYSEKFSEVQLQHVWRASELAVEKDKHDLLVVMEPWKRHGVMTVLSLFTRYEVYAGEDWWNTRFKEIFRGPEFQRMGLVNAMTEIAVHKPFYQKINQVFGLDTDEFYSDYVNDPVLKARIDHIDSIINHPNGLIATAGFSFIEGAVLYSSFAFLKARQQNGENEIKTIVSGVNYSLADEGLHAVGAATAYRHLEKEALEDGVYEGMFGKREDVQKSIVDIAKLCYEHELRIIDMVFAEADLTDPEIVKEKQSFIGFVGSRLNECLVNLGIDWFKFPTDGDTVSEWFYRGITSFVMHDFFNSLGSQYTTSWTEEDFDPDNMNDEE